MKKRLALCTVMALGIILPSAKAAEPADIFNRTKTWAIGMTLSNWEPKGGEAFSPNYGFNTSLTKTYFVHKNPIGGFVKFGIDASWFDITYVNYTAASDWGVDPDDYLYGSDEYMAPRFRPTRYDFGYEDEGEDDGGEIPNLGSHQIDIAMGVGVSATFAPFFATSNDNLAKLKAKLYCRFLPTYSLMLISEPDDTRFNHAFVPYVSFGGQISWKVLSIFVEGRWGKANYKIGGMNEDESEDEGEGGISDMFKFDKVSCKNYGVRFGIGLNF